MKLYELKLPNLITLLRTAGQIRHTPEYGVNLISCPKEVFDILQCDQHVASGWSIAPKCT